LREIDIVPALKFSGIAEKVKVHYYAEWTLVSDEWRSENRYRKMGTETKQTAQDMLGAVKKLLTIL